MKNVVVIIPTLNEALNIEEIIKKVLNTSLVFKIIIVDDSSVDGTQQIVKNLQKDFQEIILLSRNKPKNFSRSYLDGFMKALDEKADIIIQMDADGSHDPKDLFLMIKELDNFDFVIGSRYVQGGDVQNWPKHRKLLSRVANLYAKLILHIPFYDITSGFNAWSSEVIQKIDFSNLSNKGYVFQTWLKWNAYSIGFKGKEVPIIFTERRLGKSKLQFQMIFESLYEVFKLSLINKKNDFK